MRRRAGAAVGVLAMGVAAAEATLVHLGRTYGSIRAERAMRVPGDDIVPTPVVVTNHAITIDAPSECVWPWLVQMGWDAVAGTPPGGSTGCSFRPTAQRVRCDRRAARPPDR